MIPMSWWRAGLVGLLICAGLPVWGHWSRQDARPRCAWDGLVIDSRFRVVVEFDERSSWEFCDVRCARSRIAGVKLTPRVITVTDEISGEELDARRAVFVRSSITTNRATGNRWHVFGHRADAERHARESKGRLREGLAHPFPLPGESR